MSLSHSLRDLVAQEVRVIHHVSYSSSVSTFCGNEIEDKNYKSIFSFPFLFQEKNCCPPPCLMSFSLKLSIVPPKS